MGALYQIKNWDTNYENAKSRTINNPAHVYMTNKHDGLQFRKLMAKKDGAEIFAAFVLMAEICSKQAPPRQGYLSNDGTELGRPYTAEDLEFMTGLKTKAFEGAFQTLANDGFTWLSIPRYTQGILDKDTTSIPEYPLDRTEQNREEQNRTVYTPTQIENIYQAYPRHVGKEVALKAIKNSLLKSGLNYDTMMERVKKFAISKKGRGEFCPHPSTWFNQGRYDDDPAEWDKEYKKDGYMSDDEITRANIEKVKYNPRG